MESKKISIIDVAKKAGVSTATVSRVINGNGGYSKATEEKVFKTIQECGFKPNVNAIGLRTNKTHSVGVIVPDITNEFFAKIVRTLDTFFLKHKYSVLICDSNEDYELEDMHIKDLIQKNVDGIIYISGQEEIKNIDSVQHIPIVYIDRCPNNAEYLIHSDNEQGGYLAAKELIEKGCEKIVLLRDGRNASTIRHRKRGFLRAYAEYGINYDESQDMICIPPDYAEAKQAVTSRIEERGLDFDGVFATNDMMALGCLHAITERGYSVPEQVKIVGFDNISLSEFCYPPLTTITQDTEQMAVFSGEALLELMGKNKSKRKLEKQERMVPVSLKVRNST